jgi:hypothetical protein
MSSEAPLALVSIICIWTNKPLYSRSPTMAAGLRGDETVHYGKDVDGC